MRTKYANPYFKNAEMHGKLLEYLDRKKPQLSPNPNINLFDEEQLPVPEKTNRSQASWVRHSPRTASQMAPPATAMSSIQPGSYRAESPWARAESPF